MSAAANVTGPPVSEALGARIPSLGYRIVIAALRLVVAFIFFIALPVSVLAFIQSRGIAVPVSIAAVTVWGIVLVALGAARYILKPTRAYGPLSIAVGAVVFAYLYYLISLSPYRFVLPGGSASLAASYSTFLELLLVVPVLEMIAGVLTTIEDVAHPKERLPFDFPA